jgi:hypothetical protein
VQRTAAPGTGGHQQRPGARGSRPFVDRCAGRGRRERIARRRGSGYRCGAAVLLLARGEEKPGVKLARGIVVARNLSHPHLAALGAQRPGHQRSGVADHDAANGVTDLSRHDHLAAPHADAGYLNLMYG